MPINIINLVLLTLLLITVLIFTVIVAIQSKKKRKIELNQEEITHLANQTKELISSDIQSINSSFFETFNSNNKFQYQLYKEGLASLEAQIKTAHKMYKEETRQTLQGIEELSKNATEQINKQKESQNKHMIELLQMQQQEQKKLSDAMKIEFEKIRELNNSKLEEIRKSVNEKLEESIKKGLKESFSEVEKSIQNMHTYLSEIEKLSGQVGGLKNILGNVKSLGNWGELMLENILSDMLSSNLYKKQFKIDKSIVDFAIVMPGKSDSEIYLPIDSKFPLLRYKELLEANNTQGKEEINKIRKELFANVKREAKGISSKYISPPHTTDFAIMYLPAEGLYAQIACDSDFVNEIRRKEKVVIAGPSTITALIGSLSIGFKTLQIQKRSNDAWRMVQVIKKEFGSLGAAMDKAIRYSNLIGDQLTYMENRTKKIGNTISSFEEGKEGKIE